MNKQCSKDDMYLWLKKCPTSYKTVYESDDVMSIDFKVFTDWSWLTPEMKIIMSWQKNKPIRSKNKRYGYER